MADYHVHLAQAEHNRQLAEKLLGEPLYHDWAITAAFYAAVHYFEQWLFSEPEKHTETSIPVDTKGRLRYTAHAWREKIIQNKLSKDAFRSFRKLRDASETARYLSLARISPRGTPDWIPAPACQYFSLEYAKELVVKELSDFRESLRSL